MAKAPSEAGAAQSTGGENRRGFFIHAAAVVIGGLLAVVPAAAALAVILDPLRRRSKGGKFLRVATLDVVPDDGVPRQFPVIAEHVDAWNESIQPVGAVYLAPHARRARCPSA